jgi:hypothetical protein
MRSITRWIVLVTLIAIPACAQRPRATPVPQPRPELAPPPPVEPALTEEGP